MRRGLAEVEPADFDLPWHQRRLRLTKSGGCSAGAVERVLGRYGVVGLGVSPSRPVGSQRR